MPNFTTNRGIWTQPVGTRRASQFETRTQSSFQNCPDVHNSNRDEPDPPRRQRVSSTEMSSRNAERIRKATVGSNCDSNDGSIEVSTVISSRRQLIKLAKIEEERELRERRDSEYLRQKYDVLLDDCESSVKSKCVDRSEYTQSWLDDIAGVKHSGEEAKVKKSDPDTSQTDMLQKKIDQIQFDTTSPMKPSHRNERKVTDQRRPDKHRETSSSNTSVAEPNLNQSESKPNTSEPMSQRILTNPQTTLAVADDQCTLTKAQIAARHVVTKELPHFYGEPENWPLFISRYNNSTKTCGFSNAENLDRLQKCLKGNALTAVKSRLLSDESVPGVISTLKMLYGRPDLIVNAMLKNIREEPAPKADKLNTLVDFAMKVGNLSSVMVEIGMEAHLSNPTVMQELVDKLPTNTKVEWAKYKQTQLIVNLKTFGEWLYKLAETISVVTEPTITKPTDKSERKYENRYENKNKRESTYGNRKVHTDSQVNVHSETSEKKVNDSQCPTCERKCKKVEDCSVFRSYDVARRWKELYDKKLCRRCLGRHDKMCNTDVKCGTDGCPYKHHVPLHDKRKHQINVPASTTVTPVTSSNNTHMAFYKTVLLRIIPVTIHAGSRTVMTFAYLDDGSDLTIVNRGLMDQLKVKGTSEPLCLLWTGDVHRTESCSQRVTFLISGTDNARTYVMKDVRTVEDLGLKRQTLVKSELVERFEYLKDVPIVDYQNALPEILIGSDNVSLIAQLRIIEGDFNQPIASETRLGWSVYGNLSSHTKVPTEAHVNPHSSACPYNSIGYDDIHQQVKDFFTLENFGVQKVYTMNSKDDERALELLKKYTKRIGDQYETALLWRYDLVELPDSYDMALKRLRCLEKHKPGCIRIINETIEDFIRKGYVSKLDDETIEVKSIVWYLPIFAVSYPKKPDKIRTVFDAAATVGGVSLNSMLLKGPDQLASLPDILRRFRQNRFAIVGDIREMFHQVKIRDEDKQAQRFLWRNGDQTKAPDQYVMNVMTFGATCSPSAAQYVKNLNAAEFEDKYPRAVEGIVKNHYVDDWLDGQEDETKLSNLINEVIEIHAHGGFEIRNFLSNSIDIKTRFGEPSTEGKQLNLEIVSGNERVLGMWWDTYSDKFTYSLKYFKIAEDIISYARSPTKREVLKILMSVFDPLGFLSHYLIHLKILLQQIWRSKLDWDEELNTAQMKQDWRNWFELLPKVEEIGIPRLISTKISPNVARSIELHVFVDASEQAFSAVAYLRVEDENGVDCALLGSKARVAPLKYLSVPRMELQAGVLGTRLLTSICEGQTIENDRKQIWTDSTTVLSWIRSDNRKYHQFVANRIGEISESTTLQEWRWISTKENVADEATKWEKPPTFTQSSRWFSGPSFLKLPSHQWPKDRMDIMPDTLEETRMVLAHRHLTIPVLIDPNRFSSWTRMHRSMAFVVRYVRNLKLKFERKSLTSGPLTQGELIASEKVIIRQAQFEGFTDEYITLKRDRELELQKKKVVGIKKSSQIYKCSPYLDVDSVIRVRGRIDRALGMPHDTKRPIILPRQHRITRLLVDNYHRTYRHRNNRTVHNEMRQRFFVPQLRVLINSVRNECQKCKIRFAKPIPPEMAELPVARLAIGFRAFTYIGIDYFGPIYVAFGRQAHKRWGMLITCLTVRAINVEIVYKMDTDSCIMGLRNHVNEYGPAEEIYSDNGTNMRGTDNELKKLVSEIDQEKMANEFTSCFTKWNFNPPVSPHMGGAWERMVRSFKTCFYDILPARNPTDDALRNLVLEVVNVVNSRPLSYVPLDHEGDEVLTPNHFIKGSSNGVKPMVDIDASGPVLRSKWKENQRLADLFWTKFVKEFLPELTRRTKWVEPAEPIAVGDIVLIIDETNKRNLYPKVKVIDAIKGSDGQVRRVRVQRSDKSALWRSAHGVAKLDVLGSGLDAPPEDIKTRGSVKNDNTDLSEAASAKRHRR